jgi:hypothetical protein
MAAAGLGLGQREGDGLAQVRWGRLVTGAEQQRDGGLGRAALLLLCGGSKQRFHDQGIRSGQRLEQVRSNVFERCPPIGEQARGAGVREGEPGGADVGPDSLAQDGVREPQPWTGDEDVGSHQPVGGRDGTGLIECGDGRSVVQRRLGEHGDRVGQLHGVLAECGNPAQHRLSHRLGNQPFDVGAVELLPGGLALDGVEDRLRAGISVADIGCGGGASTIIMAKAYPASRFRLSRSICAGRVAGRSRVMAAGRSGATTRPGGG